MQNILKPPESVHLMKKLDRAAFNKTIKIPVLHAGNVKVSSIIGLLKKFLLKLENFKAIYHNNENLDKTLIYLNPELVNNYNDLPTNVRNELQNHKLTQENVQIENFTIKYENFGAEAALNAILPKNNEGFSSYTKIGHIVHVNLREHLIPYKEVIGEILFDKIKACSSVVNKVNSIDNTYRNFKMEILKGSENMFTSLKENNCRFEFDFSTVYWNSRLCTEHSRIVNMLNSNGVLFDVFAGVGPFSIPAAKKKCLVFANDLNPESYKYLMHNKKLNKISDEYFQGYNLDGREFIITVIKENFLKLIENNHQILITMNLPALAVEFLNSFIGLFSYNELPEKFEFATIFVYCFAKGDDPENIARNLILENLKVKGVNIEKKISEIFKVRTVSNMKEMMRVTLKLDRDILVGIEDMKRKGSIKNNDDLKKFCAAGKLFSNGQKQEETEQRIQNSRSEEFESQK